MTSPAPPKKEWVTSASGHRSAARDCSNSTRSALFLALFRSVHLVFVFLACPSSVMVRPLSKETRYILFGVALRVALLCWGAWQDANAEVPYTDIDYAVFSDAAAFIARPPPNCAFDVHSTRHGCAQGPLPRWARRRISVSSPRQPSFLNGALSTLASLGDPYARSTYRYTPLLALAVAPSHLLHFPSFGKWLFVVADLGCGALMCSALKAHAAKTPSGAQGSPSQHLPGILWLLNPFPAQISTRGSAESVLGLLVLAFVALLLLGTSSIAMQTRRTRALCGSAVALGTAAHLKLYPVIYGAPVLALLYNSPSMTSSKSGLSKLWSRHTLGLWYGVVAAAAFGALNVSMWAL